MVAASIFIPDESIREYIDPLVLEYFDRVPGLEYTKEWLMSALMVGHTSNQLALVGINESDEVVGFLLVYFGTEQVHNRPIAFIQAMFVHMGHLNRHVGEAMLQRAEQFAKMKGAEYLSGVISDDKRVKAWHRRYGFERVGILLRRRLNGSDH